jgi:hypothetical protein
MALVGAAANGRVGSGVLWRMMNAEHVHSFFFFSDWLLNLERGEVDGQVLCYLCSYSCLQN